MKESSVTIKVTAEHIAEGKRGSASKCPAALAIEQQFPGIESVSVGLNALAIAYTIPTYRLWIIPSGKITKFITYVRPEVSAFLKAYDAGYTAEPFQFTLPLPS